MICLFKDEVSPVPTARHLSGRRSFSELGVEGESLGRLLHLVEGEAEEVMKGEGRRDHTTVEQGKVACQYL